MSKAAGRRRGSAIAVDIQPPHQWTSLNADKTGSCKTTKKEEEKRHNSEKYIRGKQQILLVGLIS
jgi:hypothetical protein